MIKATMVLEGGAKRGVFTAGVLDYLGERELYTSHVVGVSAGACNALDYVSRQTGRTKDCMIQKDKKYRYYAGVRTVVKERTLLDMEKLFHRFPLEDFPFDFDTYFKSEAVCELVVTNCETGKAEYLSETGGDKERAMKICRASSSMPLVAPVVRIDDVPYLDGGIADSVPIRHAMEYGNKKMIVVLTRQRGYRKKIPSIAEAKLYHRAYGKKYPCLVSAILGRPQEYNRMAERIERLEDEGKIFVVRPQIPTVSRLETDCDKLNAFYMHGYELMRERYDELLQFLGIADPGQEAGEEQKNDGKESVGQSAD